MHEFDVDVISTVEQLNQLEQDWKKFLTLNSHHTLYHTPGYWKSALATLGPDQTAHVVILYRSDEDKPRQVIAVAPFVRQKSKLFLKLGILKLIGIGIDRLSLPGNAIAVAGSEEPEDVIGFILDLLGKEKLNLVNFDCLPLNGALCSVLDANREHLPGGFQFRINEQQTLRGIAFESSFDDYMAGMSKKTRYNLRRSVKLFADKTGSDPQLVKVDREQDVESFFTQLDEIYQLTWQAKTFGYSPRATSTTIAHHKNLARNGILRSYLLVSDSKAVAFIRGYQYLGKYYFEEIGYDADWRALQPGTVLNLLAIEDMFKGNPPDTLDFGYGENDYKRILGNTECQAALASLVADGSKASIVLAAQRMLNEIYSTIRRIIIALGLDKAIRRLLKRR